MAAESAAAWAPAVPVTTVESSIRVWRDNLIEDPAVGGWKTVDTAAVSDEAEEEEAERAVWTYRCYIYRLSTYRLHIYRLPHPYDTRQGRVSLPRPR